MILNLKTVQHFISNCRIKHFSTPYLSIFYKVPKPLSVHCQRKVLQVGVATTKMITLWVLVQHD